jgi:hypothetical protein
MEHRDAQAFMEMLTLYRRMWVRYKVVDALNRNPHVDLDELTEWTEGVANEGLGPLFSALEEGRDVLDALREAIKAVAPPDAPLNR